MEKFIICSGIKFVQVLNSHDWALVSDPFSAERFDKESEAREFIRNNHPTNKHDIWEVKKGTLHLQILPNKKESESEGNADSGDAA